MQLSEKNYFSVYEDITYSSLSSDDCECKTLCYSDEFSFCKQCGAVNYDHSVPEYDFIMSNIGSKKSTYKRRLYARQRIKLLCGHGYPMTNKFKKFIERLKHYEDEINSLSDLRKIMKKLKYNEYFKFEFSIWNLLKNEYLISLTEPQKTLIVNEFHKINCDFNSNNGKRKNIFNYYSIFFKIMKENSMEGYEYIHLPKNHDNLFKLVQ